MEPGTTKFIYYFLLQRICTPKEQRVNATKHLMELSERELNTLVDMLGAPKLKQDATLTEMWELDMPH